MQSKTLFNLMLQRIKAFPKIPHPSHKYSFETSRNPVYSTIDEGLTIPVGEKRIWVMRSDGTLAIGIKNTLVDKGNTNLRGKISEKDQQQIDFRDRFGHPSLSLPENEYDGSVHYAGWFYQHANELKVLICSGRYSNHKLSPVQKKFLESYITLKLIETYGEQKITFTDWKKNGDLEDFLQNTLILPQRLHAQTSFMATIQCLSLFYNFSMNETEQRAIPKMVIATVIEQIEHLYQLGLGQIMQFLILMLASSSGHILVHRQPASAKASLFFQPEKIDLQMNKITEEMNYDSSNPGEHSKQIF